MEGQGQQRERTSSRRRQRRKSKTARSKVVVEPVLIAARRPDSPRLETGFRSVVASAQPKAFGAAKANGHSPSSEGSSPAASNGHAVASESLSDGLNGMDGLAAPAVAGELDAAADVRAGSDASGTGVVRRRTVRIVKVADNVLTQSNREQQLLDRLVRSQGRGAISRAADDLWDSQFVAPKRQEVQIQLLEHENEHRARDAVFIMAELLQREAPIKRPVLDQRLRRLETSAEDPITRDAAGALRRSMRVHHGGL
ncbi:MAG TPA: hypothetical protein VMG12_05630 [Polyangiaceae bacterium]|nr:hypothetical protein [Polyangiaceae bacterium]